MKIRWIYSLIVSVWLMLAFVNGGAALNPGESAGSIFLPLIQQYRNQAGIPLPVLKWQHGGCYSSWCETGWYSSPAVADLDGDGSMEVIGSAYSIFVLDGETGQ